MTLALATTVAGVAGVTTCTMTEALAPAERVPISQRRVCPFQVHAPWLELALRNPEPESKAFDKIMPVRGTGPKLWTSSDHVSIEFTSAGTGLAFMLTSRSPG